MPIHQELLAKLENISHSLILLDIDGTLVADSVDVVEPWAIGLVNRLRESNNEIVLVTNSSKKDRNEGIARQLNLPLSKGGHRKPLKAAAGIYLNSHKPKIVVGDKWVTDGLFARNIDATFVKSPRLSSENELISTQLTYMIDDLIGCFISFFVKKSS